jgi:hypothetical protein
MVRDWEEEENDAVGKMYDLGSGNLDPGYCKSPSQSPFLKT